MVRFHPDPLENLLSLRKDIQEDKAESQQPAGYSSKKSICQNSIVHNLPLSAKKTDSIQNNTANPNSNIITSTFQKSSGRGTTIVAIKIAKNTCAVSEQIVERALYFADVSFSTKSLSMKARFFVK